MHVASGSCFMQMTSANVLTTHSLISTHSCLRLGFGPVDLDDFFFIDEAVT
nr:MAG TPA: hypothetical protein [Caudoviricetes sp.]